jgi:hypothetical protein
MLSAKAVHQKIWYRCALVNTDAWCPKGKPIQTKKPSCPRKTQKDTNKSNIYNYLQPHTMGKLLSLCSQLICFVTFVFFVDERGFKVQNFFYLPQWIL